jgi:DNA topoisomerase-1
MSDSQKISLVIVESPAKARTISKFLGKNFQVEASIGHIRDLPQGAKEIPEKFRREPWAYLGVNVTEQFEPIYIVPPDKKKQVSKLKDALKNAKDLYLATDEDREGEAISWHLREVLNPKVPVKRLVFHEITREAITNALENTREIDEGLVKAQETRRIVDRLYGFDVSQLLWKKVGPKLSAGRVQSVAVRLIVQRERERIEFRSGTYFDLVGTFKTLRNQKFQAVLVSVEGKRIPSGKDFDGKTGKLKDSSLLLLDQAGADALANRLRGSKFKVLSVEEKPFTEKPKAPFTTSTLQQEANRKLGFTARRTMQVAQSLYENGYITYMRTDSTSLAKVAVDAARDLVRSQYGPDFLHPSERSYATKVKNAQEAHEAIRPAGHPFQLPEKLRGELDHDQFRLFDMIWKRTIASQMADAQKKRITVTLEADGAVFQASGTSIEFEGFLRAYVEGSDDPDAELAQTETLLPEVKPTEQVGCDALDSKSHTTQPPARYTEASLTRALEEMGIGRPSTYASIIDTIQQRDYVFKRGTALVPSWTAFTVVRLLEDHFGSLVDYEFTAQMEDYLDAISRNEKGDKDYLQGFYFGEHPGLKRLLEDKVQEIDPRASSRFSIGAPTEGEHREEIFVRVGRYGPFLEQGERKASLPDGMPPEEVTLDKAIQLLSQAKVDEEPLGHDPESGKPVYMKNGRFGPYVQLGSNDDEDKPKNASLLKGMTPDQVTLEQAIALLSLPRNLGPHPESGDDVVASNGRYGPYVKCGVETRSLPADVSPIDVSMEQALALLATPKTRGGRGAAAPKAPLKELGASPVTGEAIKLLDGRYGPYVTDGATNASLPKGLEPDGLTLEKALELLAERAASAPAGRGKRGKAAAKKAATAKPAAEKTKKAPKKKTTKKKS